MSKFERNMESSVWDQHPHAKKAMIEIAIITDACLDYIEVNMEEITIRPSDVLSMVDLVLSQANYLAAVDTEND